MFPDIPQRKNTFLEGKKEEVAKVKNWQHFHRFILGKIGLKTCFTIFSKQKTAFKTTKRRSPKIRKIGIFSNGLVHGFSQKLDIFFHLFFLGKIGEENMFHDILK